MSKLPTSGVLSCDGLTKFSLTFGGGFSAPLLSCGTMVISACRSTKHGVEMSCEPKIFRCVHILTEMYGASPGKIVAGGDVISDTFASQTKRFEVTLTIDFPTG